MVFASTSVERAGAAERLAQEVRATAPKQLSMYAAGSMSGWIRLEEVPRANEYPRDVAVEVLGVASMTGDGYAREEAIRRLGALGHRRAVPFLMLRLGDWVPQVRDAARSELERLLPLGIESELIRCHALIDRLLGIQRSDLTATHAWLTGVLRGEPGLVGLRSGLGSQDMRERRYCLRLLAGVAGCDQEVVRAALGDPDPGIRAWLAGRVISGRVGADRKVLRVLLSDAASVVSTKMIRALGEQEIEEHADLLLELACSDARPVRESARFALRSIGRAGIDRYARRLISGAQEHGVRSGWVAALAECGGEEDIEVVARFLAHPRASVRASALSGMGRLDSDSAARAALMMLDDPSSTVRRVVIRLLSGVPGDRWAARAEQLLQEGTPGVQRSMFDLLVARGGWEMLVPVLHAFAMDDPALRARSWWVLGRWHDVMGRYGWLRPEPELLGRLLDLCARIDASVAESAWQRHMHWWLVRMLDDCRREVADGSG